MAPLPARNIEEARADGKLEQVEQARDVAPILFRREERFVFEEIVSVEVRRPPLGPLGQKNTGSR